MKKYFLQIIICYSLFIINLFCYSQHSKIDSILFLLKKDKDDTTKVNHLNNLAWEFSRLNPDTAILLSTQALHLSAVIDDQTKKSQIHFATKTEMGRAYEHLGILSYYKSDYALSLEHYSKALAIWNELEKYGNQKNLILNFKSATFGNIGIVYRDKGDYPKALEYYFKALRMGEELGDKTRIAIQISNIASVYYRQGDYPKALEYYFKSLKMAEELESKTGIANILGNIGSVYSDEGDSAVAKGNKTFALNNKYPKSLEYYFKAMKMYEALGDKSAIATLLGNIGAVYAVQGENCNNSFLREEYFTNALDNYFKALKIKEEFGDKNNIELFLSSIGSLYLQQNKLNDADKFLRDALKLSEEIGDFEGIKETNQNLSSLYQKKGDWKKSLEHYKKFIAAKDSINNEENAKKQTRIEMNYGFEKKEAAAKAEQEKKDAVAATEVKRQKIIRNSIAGGFAGMLVFSLIVYRQRNRIAKEKKRSEELLLNILPSETAEELKLTGHAEPKQFDMVTVLFTDFKGFTLIAEKLSAKELVGELDFVFKKFDEIISKYPIEKIKTIGDAYMCAGGLPAANTTNAMDVTLAGLEIQRFIEEHNKLKTQNAKPAFEIRIGIHTGPIVAGIVGIKKFAYDIWGDTVNTASRMESSGEAGKVNISGATFSKLQTLKSLTGFQTLSELKFIYRGEIEAKHKGKIKMYFVERK